MKELASHKTDIVRKWFEAALEGYPAETALFLRTNRDRFRNPVGSELLRCLDSLAGSILDVPDHDAARRALADILSVRAVQDCSPSEAVRFIPALKGILREIDGLLPEERAELEGRVDDLLLAAFDIYMERREKIFDLRVKEIKSGILTMAEEKE